MGLDSRMELDAYTSAIACMRAAYRYGSPDSDEAPTQDLDDIAETLTRKYGPTGIKVLVISLSGMAAAQLDTMAEYSEYTTEEMLETMEHSALAEYEGMNQDG